MRLPDTNVLLYAVNNGARQQPVATRWLEDAFSSPGGIGFAWVAVLGFVRISTRSGIFPRPLGVEDAFQFVDAWLTHPAARVVQPGGRHAELLGRLLVGVGTAGNLTTDAHLAALAIEHGATLGTFDRDFGRFAGIDCQLLGA